MVSAQYFAPRGKERLMFLGEQLALKHLSYTDRLIAIIGDAGAGKSSFIKGMFPGLQLSNDDDVVNPQKILQARNTFLEIDDSSTFHLDIRFQMAFTQMYEIADYVNSLLERNRRVVIEHFNLLYPVLGRNADLIVGIGEEIIITRPSMFGPLPQSIYDMVHESLKYRKKAHTAEDITMRILNEYFSISEDQYYCSDIRNGFLLKFPNKPQIDLDLLETKAREIIARNIPISYYDEDHIMMGDKILPCDGPRFHVRNTSEIDAFHIYKEFVFDPKTKAYCLVGLIDNNIDEIENRNTQYFLTRHIEK